ncbi:hypothetical protein ACHAXT_005734 [Thalassiosira profunda]
MMYQQPNDETLLSLLRGNDIEQLKLDCGRRMSEEGTHQLVAALAKCSSLKDFQLKCSRSEAEEFGGDILSALKNSPSNLTRLSLNECHSDWSGCAELGELIKNSPLEELDLSQNGIDDEGLALIGRVLGDKPSLKTLILCSVGMDEFGEGDDYITPAGWRAFFGFLKGSSFEAEKLELQWGHNDVTARALTDALGTNNTTLKTLRFWNNLGLSPSGWCSFFTTVLGNCSALEHLDCNSCNSMDEYYQPIFDNRIATALANALDGNKTLRTLDLTRFNSIDQTGWAIIMARVQKLLFDSKSLGTVISSNHTLSKLALQGFADKPTFPRDLASLLWLNQSGDTDFVMGEKVRIYYATYEATDEDDEQLMRELTKDSGDVDIKVMPFVLSWAGKRDSAVLAWEATGGWGKVWGTRLYRLLRRDPTVLGPEKGNESAAGKRKRN